MTTAERRDQAAFLVFADDWGRHPSSCQHLVRRLLDRHQVVWVNTIGTRKPRFGLATLRRGLEKFGQWTRSAVPPSSPHPNLQVLNPMMWPHFSSPLARRLNRRLLLHQLTPVIRSLSAPVIAVTVIPLVADLMGLLPVSRWAYYCVDDFSLWPGLDQPTLRQMEQRLVTESDILIAASETLQEKLARMGRYSSLLTHGVDLGHWTSETGAARLMQIESLARPLVVFWGVIDRRMDFEFVNRLAADLPRGTIALVGPENDPDPRLFQSPRVVRIPPLPFEQLPALARKADVLVMPYADTPVNQAIQPLKLKEYLATGRPTVVRDLPAVRPWADCLDVATTSEEFSRLVRLRLADGLPNHQRLARARIVGESWDAKAAEFERLIMRPDEWRIAS